MDGWMPTLVYLHSILYNCMSEEDFQLLLVDFTCFFTFHFVLLNKSSYSSSHLGNLPAYVFWEVIITKVLADVPEWLPFSYLVLIPVGKMYHNITT